MNIVHLLTYLWINSLNFDLPSSSVLYDKTMLSFYFTYNYLRIYKIYIPNFIRIGRLVLLGNKKQINNLAVVTTLRKK